MKKTAVCMPQTAVFNRTTTFFVKPTRATSHDSVPLEKAFRVMPEYGTIRILFHIHSKSSSDVTACKPDSVPDAEASGGNHLSMRPEPGIANVASSDIIPYLVLLQEGFTMRRGSRLRPVGSYSTFSPLPEAEAPGGILSVALAFPRRIVRGILP